jgi:hypothetical protein
MGGGAGISWELELEPFPLAVKVGKLVPERKPVIGWWLAEDYGNCMDGIRPDLLRIVSIEISDPNSTAAPDLGGYDWVATMDGHKLKASSGGGYTRGPWHEYFPLTFTGQMHVAYYGDLNITLVVTYRRKREFGIFFKRLFDSYLYTPSDKTIERFYGNLESYYAGYWERFRARYEDS